MEVEEEEASSFLATKRYAVVTGANRGIGFEVCRQLASKGVIVVLTARDETKGREAIARIESEEGISNDFLFFHRLDVMDPSSISSLADFIDSQFGRLDILVNNAGIGGIKVNTEALRSSTEKGVEINWKDYTSQTYEMAINCLETNYYGVKRTTEALIPFLNLSNSPRIVNVSSTAGKLQYVCNEWAVGILSDEENLSEYRVDEVVREFLKDFELGLLEANEWPSYLSAYTLSKAALNAYTRILSKRYHGRSNSENNNFMINSVCPGYVKTNSHAGLLTVQEGAASPVSLALSHEGGQSGLFFSRKCVSSF